VKANSVVFFYCCTDRISVCDQEWSVVSGQECRSGLEERLSQTKFHGKKQNCYWIGNVVALPMYHGRTSYLNIVETINWLFPYLKISDIFSLDIYSKSKNYFSVNKIS